MAVLATAVSGRTPGDFSLRGCRARGLGSDVHGLPSQRPEACAASRPWVPATPQACASPAATHGPRGAVCEVRVDSPGKALFVVVFFI